MILPDIFASFKEVWAFDFEFNSAPGENPIPVCLVATELRSKKTIRLFRDELLALNTPPYCVDESSLFIAFFASAELNCHLALGWNLPVNVIDLYVEFKGLTNDVPPLGGRGLTGAMSYFGLDFLSVGEKQAMRELAMREGPWSDDERIALLDYCKGDVDATGALFEKMIAVIDAPRALLRGRYMRCVAEIEHTGVGIDTEALAILRDKWDGIKDQLILELDRSYGVFEGRTFKADRFAAYLSRSQMSWPRLDSGALDLSDKIFRQMAKQYPAISSLRELRSSLSKMRLAELSVGRDGRNRCLLSPFQSRTSRNQPSNSKFIFGPSVWLRSLIRPKPGFAIAYIDWSQQEFGVAAALSRDSKMIEAYNSGDPYLAFAKQAGAVPQAATKQSHAAIREQYKMCVLAVQYGMGEHSLAVKTDQSVSHARLLLRMHRETYPVFWRWSDAVVDRAMLHGSLTSAFGWSTRTTQDANPRFLRNFPMQANGAEMLRIATIFLSERGVKVCAPIHDAILIEASTAEIDEAVEKAKLAMSDASAVVLNGFRLKSDATIVRHPDRFSDKRGLEMWNRVWGIIGKSEFQMSHATL